MSPALPLGIHTKIPDTSFSKPRPRRGLTMEKKVKNGVLVLDLRGRFDLQSYTAFHDTVDSFLRTHPGTPSVRGILIHMGELESIDSAAIGLLILIKRKLASKNNAKLWLCNIPPAIFELFEITQLHRVFPIVEGRDEIIESIPSHPAAPAH
ncbi:MAG: STAS domain-containing protein [Spirochaetia bacterium]|nr:STAS domain-containing protein [Spirochaetia bacterium]